MLLPLICSIIINSATTVDPEFNLGTAPLKGGTFRANIIGASYLFSSIPVGATVAFASFTVEFTRGDRISVNDATFAYIYDGTDWLPLRGPFGIDRTTSLIIVDKIVSEKYVQTFNGDNSYNIINLDSPAYAGTLEIVAITSKYISHDVLWEKDNHYEEVTLPPLEGQALGDITSVSPIVKWFPRTKYLLKYVKK